MRNIPWLFSIVLICTLIGCSKENETSFNEREMKSLKEELQQSRAQQQIIESLQDKITKAESRITKLSQDIRDLKKQTPNQYSVTLLGHVNKPGTYKTSKPMTVLEAFGYAGGLRDQADPQHVVVRQNQKDSSEIDLEQILIYGEGQNHKLKDGTVFIVPEIQTTD